MNEQQLNEARVFHLAGEAMLPLIYQMKDQAFDELMNASRAGVKDLVGPVSKLAAINTLIEEIQTKMNVYQQHLPKGDK